MVFTLQVDLTGVVVFNQWNKIRQNTKVAHFQELVSVPVGDALCGRVVDALGNTIDNQEDLVYSHIKAVEVKAPGIVSRQKVNQPLQTGILAIDSMFPIGRGQRELIIGDRQMGKTTIAVDTILNQYNLIGSYNYDVYSIYVAIGQRRSAVAHLVSKLKSKHAFSNTIVVAATASDSASLQYLAPYTGCTIGEYFRDEGKHSLIVYDDLSKHAVAYRQISLLLNRPPGREAYPGDVFYLHSRLLERSAKLHDNLKGGSLTALPVIETQAGDVSGYIPTNVISITDGQIFLDSDLFYSNVLPAISIGLSVSRIGSAAQTPLMKTLANTLKLNLAFFKEIEAFTMMDSELDSFTAELLEDGQKLVELIKQKPYDPLSAEMQVVLIYTWTSKWIKYVHLNQIQEFKSYFLNKLKEVVFTYAAQDILKVDLKKKVLSNRAQNWVRETLISFLKSKLI